MRGRVRKPNVRQLDAMIAEALIDACGDEEQASAWRHSTTNSPKWKQPIHSSGIMYWCLTAATCGK